jgi:hypothetical protein
MNQQRDYQNALTLFQTSAANVAKELSKLYALLHTRITRAVQPVRGCANAAAPGLWVSGIYE